MQLEVRPDRALQATMAMIGALLVINLLSYLMRYVFDHDYVYGLIPIFDVRLEKTVPTYFSVLLIMANVPVLCVIGMATDQKKLYWFFLAAILAFLSMDEFLGFHERISNLIVDETAMESKQLAWPIPYLAAAAVIGFAFLSFLLALPRRSAVWFVASGIVYIMGAAGLEMASGWYTQTAGPNALIYDLFALAEEITEMIGMALFLYALLDHLVREHPDVTVGVRSA